MTLELLERITYAPVKKHAYRRKITSARKFYSVRKNIFADYSEKVAGEQPEKTEISALDIRRLLASALLFGKKVEKLLAAFELFQLSIM